MAAIPESLAILWEDPHGLAVNKPPGLLTHAANSGAAEVTLDALVRRHLRPAEPQTVYLGTVHRLDRPVSGVVLWAKTSKAAHRWADQFARRQVRKEYWALVEATDDLEPILPAVWTDWIQPPDRDGRAHLHAVATPGSVVATTRVERFEVDPFPVRQPFFWLRLFPATGRTHQLRAQTAARGWPILGDATYGASKGLTVGIALHARSLLVTHPARQEPLALEASLPDHWLEWTDRTGH